MRKIWDIPGGIHPLENKEQSNHRSIANIALPDALILPLNQHIGAPAIATVNVGDSVLKGQKIADAQGPVSAPVHAPTSGTITHIEERPIPHSSGLSAPCIVIEPDGKDTWTTLEPIEDYRALKAVDLVQRVREAGIAGMGGAGFPSAIKLNPRADNEISSLILNGTECEPYITSDDLLMRERASEVIKGAEILAYILGEPEEVLIGVEDNKPEAIAALNQALALRDASQLRSNIEIVSFPTKYPSGGEKQLIQILTGKEVPSGGLPAQIGVVVQNVGTAAAIYHAVELGRPLISRITTVVGEALETQQNIEVLLGTPIDHILEEHGFKNEQCNRLIVGGPMMGFAIPDSHVPVIKTTNCILAPTEAELPTPPPAQACIRCGMCSEACPASLLPQQLYWFSQSEDFDKLKSHNLFDCIECGACSFECPSNIPLVQYYRASKASIRQLESDKQKSDRSRERFEFRKERIAKAEAEKEAKREARKKAAEEAKRVTQEKAARGEKPEPLAAAPKAETSNQKPKLERAVSSAQSRLERAQKQLAEAESNDDSARIEILQARLKEAEIKLDSAKQKLKQYDDASDSADSPESKASAEGIKNKLTMSASEKIEKTIATLEKRIEVAKQKYQEAVDSNSENASAFLLGVEKLESKLSEAKKELNESSAENSQSNAPASSPELSAAEQAIAKAKAKAQAQANMSEEELKQAKLKSLQERLEKAEIRLASAVSKGSEHVEAFQAGVEKLKAKLEEFAD